LINDIRRGFHYTPGKSGPLRIIGADGDEVKIVSDAGEEFVFDAGDGRFISPFLEPLPTLKPTPTPVPTPVPPPVGRP